MSEPITLTYREREELLDYMMGSTDMDWRERTQGFIDKLNELRAPNPVGTVRADEDGNVAIKVASIIEGWYVYRLRSARCHSWECEEYLADWPIVYKPPAVE